MADPGSTAHIAEPPNATPSACLFCGYPLVGLPSSGACPECGVTLAAMATARGFHHANHRWLSRLVVGIDLYLVSLLFLAIVMLVMLARLLLPYPLVVYVYHFPDITHMINVLGVLSIWLITAPEPARPRVDAPRFTRASARWLTISGTLLQFLCTSLTRFDGTCLLLTQGELVWLGYVAHTCSAVGVVCALLMLRRYAIRNADPRSARAYAIAAILALPSLLLEWVTVLAGYGYTPVPNSAMQVLLQGTILLALAQWATRTWAMLRFRKGLRQCIKASDRKLHTRRHWLYTTCAVIAGIIAAGICTGILTAKLPRAGADVFADAISASLRFFPYLGAIIGIIVLTPHAERFHNTYTRSQRLRMSR